MINIRTLVSPYPSSSATWATEYHLGINGTTETPESMINFPSVRDWVLGLPRIS